nr:substrate-binding domain-containing protein [Propioniciclava coleopterorum]
MVHSDFTRDGGRRAARDLLADDTITAIIASSDTQSIGLLAEAHAQGRRVPDDLSVVAFDGTEVSRYARPALTAIEQPIEALAAGALGLVLASLADPDRPAEHIALPSNLAIRASTGTPRTIPG